MDMNNLTYLMGKAPAPPAGWIDFYRGSFTPIITPPKRPMDERIGTWEYSPYTFDLPEDLMEYQTAYRQFVDDCKQARWIGEAKAMALWTSIWARAVIEASNGMLDKFFKEAFPY